MKFPSASQIFSPTAEALNIGLPLAFLFLALVETFFGLHPSENERRLVIFSSYYFLLNHLHIYLTPLAFFIFPEFSQWAKDSQFRSLSLLKIIIISFSLLFLALVLIRSTTPDIYKPIFFAIFIVRGFWGFHHNLFQTYGFSCLYEKMNGKTALLYHLKKYFYVLWALGGVNIWLTFLNYKGYADTLYSAFTTLVVFGLVLFLHWKIFRNTLVSSGYLKFYIFRLYLFVLAPFSTMAFAGYLAAHGVEYCLLFFLMRKKTKRIYPPYLFTIVVLLVFVVFGIPYLSREFPNAFNIPPGGQIAIIAFLSVGDMLHYTLDSFLFKLTNSASKKNILPLILPDKTTYQ